MSADKPSDQVSNPETRSRRQVTPTEKGNEHFEHLVKQHLSRINKVWNVLDTVLKSVSEVPDELNALLSVKSNITKYVQDLESETVPYLEFLNRCNSEQSKHETDEFNVTFRSFQILIDSSTRKLTQRIQDVQLQENISTSSKQSKISKASIRSSIASSTTRKRAKAEALNATLKFAEEEAILKKKQAEIEFQQAIAQKATTDISVEIGLLNTKREAAALNAEVSALEQSVRSSILSNLDSLEVENPVTRTDVYVNNLPNPSQNPVTLAVNSQGMSAVNQGEYVEQNVNSFTNQYAINNSVPLASCIDLPSIHETNQSNNGFIPPSAQPNTGNFASDFTKFLLKRELLLSRLTNFNDKPEFYPSWKNSFKSIINELQATPSEEVDLLVKWSGPLSQKHILSIKAANSNNPYRALTRIWIRMDERYGCPEMMESALKSKLDSFAPIQNKDVYRLYDLSDILDEIEAAKEDKRYACLLAYFDSSTGVTPVVKKLPYNLQEKWTNCALKYMRDRDVPFPPFNIFAAFVREQSRNKNNPSFAYHQDKKVDNQPSTRTRERNINVSSHKTEISKSEVDKSTKCPLHNTNHSLSECKGFRMKSLEERRNFLKDKNICFRCCESSSHKQRDCKAIINCEECHSSYHPTALHRSAVQRDGGEKTPYSTTPQVRGQTQTDTDVKEHVTSSCTQICGKNFEGKSCAKTVLVRVYPKDEPHRAVKMYAVIDDQSNRSLASPEFYTLFNIFSELTTYELSSCGGTIHTSGRKAEGFVIEAYDGSYSLQLPSLIECSQVPNIREEIPTPEVARYYNHLVDIANFIPTLDPDAEIMLLLGRDAIQAHHVLDQRIGQGNQPYGQKLNLGWTIIGETCLGKTHKPEVITTFKTHLLGSGRVSLFPPCNNEFKLREDLISTLHTDIEDFGRNVFQRTKDDEKPGMSVDDNDFIRIMDDGFQKENGGNWTAPLPFRQPRPRLPNNRVLALKRAKALDSNLQKDQTKKQHFLEFMDGILKNGHAELAPPVAENEECWFLPIFGIYHPKKPEQLRGVFDSSSKYGELSLNDVLLTGPDMINSLLGVLLRFRKEPIAIMGDVRQMFYCFKVHSNHRNFLRFFWYEDNDCSKPMIEYRMTVHVFGNSPSPAIATYGLHKTADAARAQFGEDVTDFIKNQFYVDDGLVSLPTVQEAVDLMKRTQQALASEGKLRLHKISSNSQEVLNSFPTDDLAKGIKDLDFGTDLLPNQRSLGLVWNLESDTFIFQTSTSDKPYTRRGVLSTINSIFDPLGFIAPVVVEGKHLLRTLVHDTVDWDEPLPQSQLENWERWKNSLSNLEDLHIPRTYLPGSLINCKGKSVHIFCDASELAIAAVGYLRTISQDDQIHLGFILGKGKLAPTHGHSVPRLELCAAVLAVELSSSISDHLSLSIEEFSFYSDSRVVLGYISNTSRRFYKYVSNRVSYIRKVTKPEQWTFVPTERNPADQATRFLSSEKMKDSSWLKGPSQLLEELTVGDQVFEIVEPDGDKEVRPEVGCNKTRITFQCLGSHRFARFSVWKNLVEAVMFMKHVAASFKGSTNCVGWHRCSQAKTVDAFQEAEKVIIKTVQYEQYSDEIECLVQGESLPNSSSLLPLDVFLDDDGLLRIGGRLNHSNLPVNEKNPVVIPGQQHIGILLIRHYHALAKHQGRHITSGTIRNAGFWIIGGKRMISSVIYKCVKCKKLRGKFEHQKMADLPPDRLQACPPFTYIGLDTFGPWEVITRRTRGGAAKSKRWAILFTCFNTRGIHIEVVEDMSSSSFINAFKRFVSIRGKVKQIRSDRGTNFIGATENLKIDAINVEDKQLKDFLYDNGTTWLFNPPHASHMGGVWERLIGVTRRILESMLSEISPGSLTHEVLTTFLAEASAIVNSRPLVAVSTDPEDPLPLSPSLILTQKPDSVVVNLPIDEKNMYRSHWKRVQHLADVFWSKWRSQYLQHLQSRRKWTRDCRNVSVGDVVLLKDASVARNYWPMGVVTVVFPSDDQRVRKAEIRVVYREGGSSVFIRPVTELIVLLPED